MDPELLSIVVPTYNDERKKDLYEFLDSAAKQTYHSIEVIVVVEKSRTLYNGLVDYMRTFPKRSKVIFSEGLRGISYARNLGIDNSSGAIIAITDDDALLSPDWAKNIMYTYTVHSEAIGVTGQALPFWNNPADSWFPKSLYWMIGCTDFRNWGSEKKTNLTSGVNMSFRSEAFKYANFATNLGAGASSEGKLSFPNEDNDYAMKITRITNRPIIYNPQVTVYHKVYSHRLGSKYIRRYAFWQGCAEGRYSDMSYSDKKRGSIRFKLIKDFSIDVLLSLLAQKNGLRKLKYFVITTLFFVIGYGSYKLGIYKSFLHFI